MRTTLAKNRARRPTFIGLTAAVFVLTAAFAVSSASASVSTVYNNIPSPLPGNVPSVGFEATQASEFGGQVQLDGTARDRGKVTVTMSSWGCENGTWNGGDCSTSPHATFSEPIALNIYSARGNDEPGTLLGRVTRTFDIPYRPSANYTHCTGDNAGKWWSKTEDQCYNGKARNITFATGGTQLPDKVIISVAYNTTHAGYLPIGEDAPCYITDGGCGYDALNVGTGDSPASVGNQPLPDDAYFNSTTGGQYCDGGAGGTGTFRLDSGCWTGLQSAFKVTAS
jgi:hypothetical protein